MSEAELEGRHPSGGSKEIDEYLHGTICEIVPDEEDLDEIAAPDDDDFDVDIKDEPEEIEDEYMSKARQIFS